MGSKVGNNTPRQSPESLAHAFQGVLDALDPDADPKAVNYLVGNKIKDESEIDGTARGDVTYLSPKSKKHGAPAAAYRLSGRRKADYKEARIYLEALTSQVRDRTVRGSEQDIRAQRIQLVLAKSKSKGYIEISAIRSDLQFILDDVKTTTEKSAEAVMKDLVGVDGSISHFLEDVEAIRTCSNSQEARRNISKQGDKNVDLSKKIENFNKQAKNLKLERDTLSQLKLKRRSFTASASATAGEVTGEDLLDKLATWPGPGLRWKVASLFDCAKPEDGNEYFKQASKDVLLALVEQESILNLINNALLNTVQSEKDRRKLQSLCNSAEELLSAFRVPDSPFTRLRNLAFAGYHWPTDTASKLAGKRAEFLKKVPTGLPPPLPVHVQPGAGNGQPAANVPRTPGNVPGNSQGLRPLPAIPGPVLPVSGSVPSPSNLAQPAASVVPSALPSLPSIPNGPPPPLPGGKLQPATVNGHGVAVGSPPDDMPAPPAALFIPPPPDDTLPPPSNVGQAAQPANNVVAAGAQPQSAISNVTLPSGLLPNAPSSPHAKPVVAGTFVKKRVDQILGPSPLMPTNPALSLTPSAKASPDMLPPANVDAGADMSVPPPEYMPPPRQDITPSNVNGSAAPANLSQSPDSSPRPVSLSQEHKDNLSKSDAEITDAIAQMNYNAPVLYKSQKSSVVADKAKLNFRIGALGEKISAKVAAAAEKIEKQMKAFNGEDRESKDQIRERKFEKHLIDNAAMNSRVISTLSDIAADSEESRLLVLEQQEKIDQLYHQTLNAPLRNAQSAVDAFVSADGDEEQRNLHNNFFRRIAGRFNKKSSQKLPESGIDLSATTLRNNQLANEMIAVGESASNIVRVVDLSFKEFEEKTTEFIRVHPLLGVLQPKNFNAKEIFPFFYGALILKNDYVTDVLFKSIGDQKIFQNLANETVKTMERQFMVLLLATRLFTDEEYVRIFPDEVRPLVREFGRSVQQLAADVLNPHSPFVATYLLVQAGARDPHEVMLKLNAAVIPEPPTDLPQPLPSVPGPTGG